MQGMVNPLGNRRGLTLVELLVSGTLAAMVLVAAVALSLAVFDATLEDPDAILLEADARRFELLLRGDVSRAVDVVSLTPWALDLLAADGDTIRYAWDGVPGSDVTRTIAAVTGVVAAEVDSLRFQALTATQPLTTETFGLTEIVGTAVSYDFGDLTAYTDTTGCWNYSMGTNKIQGRYQVGVTFDATADHDTLITASVRVAAIDQFPPAIDTAVEVYTASEAGGLPDTLLASGTLAAASVTPAYAWHDVPLTMTGNGGLEMGRSYWILLRINGTGPAYAGTVEWEAFADCTTGEGPDNGLVFRQTGSTGNWLAADTSKDMPIALTSRSRVFGVTEITQTLTPVTSIDYALALVGDGHDAARAGTIALAR